MKNSPRILAGLRGRLGAYAPELSGLACLLLKRMARQAGLDSSHEISLLLTDNPSIRRLNRQWRGIDQSTDVLSFPCHELKAGAAPPGGPVGDIVISLPYLRRAAPEAGHTPEHHLAWLLAHGLLHLLGHDHMTDVQAGRMRREELSLVDGKMP